VCSENQEFPKTLSRSQNQFTKRLTLFYVFNDIVQYAARSQLTDYLECGSSIFLPEVGLLIERLSHKERSPFIRTLTIWQERHVFSSTFIGRVRAHWERPLSDSSGAYSAREMKDPTIKTPHQLRNDPTRSLLHGDPKLVSVEEISKRLSNQIRISNELVQNIEQKSAEAGEKLIPVTVETPRTDGTDYIRGLRASLSAELMV